MRLIDADELIKDIMSYKTMPEIRKAICEVIDDAPTIKTFTLLDIEENFKKGLNIGLSYAPEDRPHGKWKFNTVSWLCSVCNQTPHTIGYCGTETFMNEYFRFCPNCGAQMIGGEDND